MNKKLLLYSALISTSLNIFSIDPVLGIAISKVAAPLCNLMQVVVTLVNSSEPTSTYNGPASATITLPSGLTFVRTDGEVVGTVTTSGQIVTWTIPADNANMSKTLTFLASATVTGTYTVTGEATDDQGLMHTLSVTPEDVTLNFPHINNGVFAIAKNATLVATLLAQLDTTTPATTATAIEIQPNAQHGTALPVLSESPFVVTYIPSPDFVGYDFFTTQASDPCTCTDTASMFIAVGVAGDPATNYATFLQQIYDPTPSSLDPVAKNIQLQSVNVGGTSTVDLRDYVDLSNSTAPFVYTTGGTPTYGTASIINSTILKYVAGGSGGTDTFSYTVTDADGNASTATVNITVTAP